MRLEERISTAIQGKVDDVQLWAPDLDSIRRTARGRARRRAAAVVSGVVAAGVVVATALGLGGGLPDRSSTPVDRPGVDRRDGGVVTIDDAGVVTIPWVRDDLVVVTPRVTSTVSPGPRLVESVSSEDPSYDGSGQLSVALDRRRELTFKASCEGAPRAHFVVVIEPRASYYNSVRCDGEGMSLPFEADSRATLRAFVTEQDPRAFRRCFNYSPPEGCDEVEPPHVPEDVGARFGLRLFENRLGPVAVRMFDQDVHARAQWRGRSYSLVTAAAGVTGASALSFRVEASDRARIAWATIGVRPGLQRCYARTGDSASCLPTVEVSVDEQPAVAADVWPFGLQRGWGTLTPGESHVITMRIVEGDPRNIDLGVWVYEEG